MKVYPKRGYERQRGEMVVDLSDESLVSAPLQNPYVPEGPHGEEETAQAYSLLLDVTLLGRNERDGHGRVIEIGERSGHEGETREWDWERARDRMARLRALCDTGRVALLCGGAGLCEPAHYVAWRLNNVGPGRGEVMIHPIRFRSQVSAREERGRDDGE